MNPRRVWPFAAVATLGYALAWLPARVDGVPLVAGLAAGVLPLALIVWAGTRGGRDLATDILTTRSS